MQGSKVHQHDPPRQQNAGRLAVQQRRAQEAHRRAPVHWSAGHVERESRHHLLLQNTEVVAKECARDAERPSGAQHKGVAGREERVRGGLGIDGEEERVRRLVLDSRFVQPVADEAEGEDSGSEGVAGSLGAATEEVRQDLVVVF